MPRLFSPDDAASMTPTRRRGQSSGYFLEDPLTRTTAELRQVQPFAARKQYICPGCNQEIRVGTGHVVIVPLNDADLRRHWHRPCLDRARRQRRR